MTTSTRTTTSAGLFRSWCIRTWRGYGRGRRERSRRPLNSEAHMQLGRVVGHAVATVKHPTLQGWRFLLVTLLTSDGKEDGEPILAIDSVGAGLNSIVVVSNDGAEARAM